MPNRVVCSVLEEMRTCARTGNYSYLPGLIEEVQVMVSRMEAALYDQKDLRRIHEAIKEAEAQLKQLKLELPK